MDRPALAAGGLSRTPMHSPGANSGRALRLDGGTTTAAASSFRERLSGRDLVRAPGRPRVREGEVFDDASVRHAVEGQTRPGDLLPRGCHATVGAAVGSGGPPVRDYRVALGDHLQGF